MNYYLEELPLELQRNLALLREVDTSSHSLMGQIESDLKQFVGDITNLDSEEALQTLRKISAKFSEALKHGEDKVALATQTYNLADQSIRRLDQDLLKFETEELVNLKPIKVSLVVPNQKPNDSTPKAAHEASSLIKKKSQKDPDPRDGRAKDKYSSLANEEFYDSFHEMPIDPYEPIYCFCSQVSFGDMVACDDELCEREWFHYQCVGLKTHPKGKWYCSECIAKQKSSNRKSASGF
ncbi:Inhibitor of growth protein 4, variant 3 [Entomophthora muscae]|uniref:Inhibitor of growth protein 4, variant 3 n=1 Tax=Entomophthora muscae TaxID=34485 RepID=A0ACC2S8A0_9FUNG|nr:Inhibitor of growth protein 4, variant 3 [Entomophthora muscae]